MHRRSGAARLRHGNAPILPWRIAPVTLSCVVVMLVAILGISPGTGSTRAVRGDRSDPLPSACATPATCAPSAPSDARLTAADQSRAIVPPNHPGANVPTQVAFNCDLYAIDETSDCIYSSLLNINYARSLEGVGPMVLPANYTSMAPYQQLFVVFNLERTSRGLPPLVELDASADNDAWVAALNSTDPPAPGSSTFQTGPSIAAFGVGNALQADWEWMYTDGCYPYIGNAGCTSISPSDPAGWGHRDAILGNYGSASAAAGTGEATASSGAYPGLPTWTAEFGQAIGGVPNAGTVFLNLRRLSLGRRPSHRPAESLQRWCRFHHHHPGRLPERGDVGGPRRPRVCDLAVGDE